VIHWVHGEVVVVCARVGVERQPSTAREATVKRLRILVFLVG